MFNGFGITDELVKYILQNVFGISLVFHPLTYKTHQAFAIRVDDLSNIAFTGFGHISGYRQHLIHYKKEDGQGKGIF